MKKSTIEFVTVLYIILFLYTGINKLMDFRVFEKQLDASLILRPFAKLIVYGLPLLEFTLVLLLIVPRWRLKGLHMSTGLMILFTLYIIFILISSTKQPCSCGGIISEMSWPQHIIFNTVLTILAIIAIIFLKDSKVALRPEQ